MLLYPIFIIFLIMYALSSSFHKGCILMITLLKSQQKFENDISPFPIANINYWCFEHCAFIFRILQNVDIEPLKIKAMMLNFIKYLGICGLKITFDTPFKKLLFVIYLLVLLSGCYISSCVLQVMRLLQKGNRARTVEPTAANKTSSRSHALLSVTVQQTSSHQTDNKMKSRIKHGKLFMIDLAGSERASQTKVIVQLSI
jgi:hypothetical protein